MSIGALKLKDTIERIRGTRYENPVVTREVRTRMRGAKAHQLMLLYVFVMALCVFVAYYSQWVNNSGNYTAQAWVNSRLGYTLFSVLTWCQAILIVLIAQGLTVGSLTIEREQQTIEMLSLTSLSARNIIAGKVAAPMLFILMLLACSLPIAFICLMFGSISPMEILISYLILAAWAFLFASAGVFFSAISKKSSAANITSFLGSGIYAWIIAFTAAESVYSGSFSGSAKFIFGGMSGCNAPDYSLALAPVFGFKLPTALVGIVMNVGLAILLLTFASTRLPYHRENRQPLIRCLLLSISLVWLFLFLGNVVFAPTSGFSGSASEFMVTPLAVMLAIISPFLPAFATGPLDKGRNILKAVFAGPTWKKVFENRPTGGFWFLITWWVAACLVIALSLVIGISSIGGSRPAMDWSMFPMTCLAILVFVTAAASLGILFSTMVPTRQAAAALVVLFIILAWVIFPLLCSSFESSYNHTWSQATNPGWNIAYLWPGMVFTSLTDHSFTQGQTGPILALPAELTNVGCAIAWSLVAALALWAAQKRHQRGGGVRDEREN